MEKISRGKRACETQKQYLINFLEINADIANDKFMTADGARFRDGKWRELAVALNALGGTQKEGHKWKKYWRDLKVNTKAKYSAIRQEEQRSGINGLRRAKALSPLEEKIIQITTIEAFDVDNTPEVGFGESKSIINASPELNIEETAWAALSACATTETSTVKFRVKTKLGTTAVAATTSDTCAQASAAATVSIANGQATTSASIANAQATASGATTTASTTRVRRAQRKRRAQESTDHVGNLFKVEEKQLKAMKDANERKREQLKLMREQMAASTTRVRRAQRKRRAQESTDHVGNLLKVEEKKLKAMEDANELKRKQLQLMREQTPNSNAIYAASCKS